MPYAHTVTVGLGFDEAVARVKDALGQQGFGVLTEIDVQATLRQKLGVETDPYLIIGACNPPLAHRALSAAPTVGVFLPCNVVVRSAGGRTTVDAMDPTVMADMIDDPTVAEVAADASRRILAALDAVTS